MRIEFIFNGFCLIVLWMARSLLTRRLVNKTQRCGGVWQGTGGCADVPINKQQISTY